MHPPHPLAGKFPRPIHRRARHPRRTRRKVRWAHRRRRRRLTPEKFGRSGHAFPGRRRQPAPHILRPVREECQPAGQGRAPHGERVGEVGHRHARVGFPPLPQRRDPRSERHGRPRREDHPVRTRRRRPVGNRRGLLEHRVAIGARQPDAGDRRAAGMRAVRRPRFGGRREGERPRRRIDRRMQVAKPQLRRDGLVPQREQQLDDAPHSSRGKPVSEIRLQRGQPAPVVRARSADRLRQGRGLHGVPPGRTRAVRLHVLERQRVHAGRRIDLPHERHLSGRAGHRDAPRGRAPVIRANAPNHPVDRVPVRQGIRQPLHHHRRDALGRQGAPRGGVKRPAFAPGRQHPRRSQDAEALRRQKQVNPTRQRQIHLPARQRLASEVERDQRRGGRRVDREGRAAQVEVVSDPPGQVTGRPADLVRPRRAGRGHREEVVVIVHHRPHHHGTAPARQRLQRIPGVLERIPRLLQKHPLLRIHHRRLCGRDPEKIRVKPLHLVQKPAHRLFRGGLRL